MSACFTFFSSTVQDVRKMVVITAHGLIYASQCQAQQGGSNAEAIFDCDDRFTGRYVIINGIYDHMMELCEVQVIQTEGRRFIICGFV